MGKFRDWADFVATKVTILGCLLWHWQTGSSVPENILTFLMWFLSIAACFLLWGDIKGFYTPKKPVGGRHIVVAVRVVVIAYMVCMGWFMTATVSLCGVFAYLLLSRDGKKTGEDI